MGEQKHTPGPWYIYEGNPNWIMAVDPDDDTPWHVAKTEPNAGPGDATPANARLIAAAPDLLEACQAVADVCADDSERRMEPDGYTALELVLAAIAKATGEAAA